MSKILFSPGFGAGWITWNDERFWKTMLTWEPLIEAVEKGERVNKDHPAVQSLVRKIKQDFGEEVYVCVLGADQLCVFEVSGPFRVEEYDGSESIVTEDDVGWITL